MADLSAQVTVTLDDVAREFVGDLKALIEHVKSLEARIAHLEAEPSLRGSIWVDPVVQEGIRRTLMQPSTSLPTPAIIPGATQRQMPDGSWEVTYGDQPQDAHTKIDSLHGSLEVCVERIDHMQERLNRQGARLRHLESLPGVAETIPADKEPAE